jgi:hypothetical protein
MRRPQATAAALFTSAALWAGIASTGDVYETSSSFVLGSGLLLVVAVAIVGMVAGASRWALRLGIGTAGGMVAFGVIFPLTPWTVAAMASAGAALAGLVGTGFDHLIRQRPAADGPPARSVLLSLLLLASPPVWALAAPDGFETPTLVAAVVTWVTLAWYAKAAPGALLLVRWITPVILLLAATIAEFPVAALIALSAVGLASLAWTVEARIAVHPLAEPGTTVPIPPELAPPDVLDAAGLDDRGRRRETGP